MSYREVSRIDLMAIRFERFFDSGGTRTHPYPGNDANRARTLNRLDPPSKVWPIGKDLPYRGKGRVRPAPSLQHHQPIANRPLLQARLFHEPGVEIHLCLRMDCCPHAVVTETT